jgi:hypothetical protein
MTPHGLGDGWDDDDSDIDALVVAAPLDDGHTGLEALTFQTADTYESLGDDGDHFLGEVVEEPVDDVQIPVVQVANPPGTIAVTAYMNGAVAQVDLDPAVTRWTESQLEQEIQAIAEVAAKRATAVMHVMVVQMFVDQGMDLTEAREFVEEHMPFATPDRAEAALSELNVRYAQHAE